MRRPVDRASATGSTAGAGAVATAFCVMPQALAAGPARSIRQSSGAAPPPGPLLPPNGWNPHAGWLPYGTAPVRQ
ncbi:hypothetical protein GCM10010245_23410 [Streptomyces spectabilis]|nr:hypothetical protein GCM10010245_23410 [Streptomyces spectabilis]